MVIFHSYVSLPDGTDGAMEGWAPTPDTMASMQTKSPIAQSFPGTSAAPGVQTRSVIPIYYPLVNVYITMENHHVQWVNPLKMAIFNSYFDITRG